VLLGQGDTLGQAFEAKNSGSSFEWHRRRYGEQEHNDSGLGSHGGAP